MDQETVELELAAVSAAVAAGDGGTGVEVGGADVPAAGGADESPAAVGPPDAGQPSTILIYVQGFTPDNQRKVLSVWNTGDEGGLLAGALSTLRDGGWLDGGDQPLDGCRVTRQRHALAAALLVSVATFESAAMTERVSLEGVETLMKLLLNGQPAPLASVWDVSGHEL